ncbi:MAG TPA: cytochrome c [Gammaproteobacteria bacterium]
MSSKKQTVKTGEKVLFGIFGVFIFLAVVAYIILESVRLTADKPMFENKTFYDFSDQGSIGSALFRESRCTSCHRALRNGTNMGLSLDGVGSVRTYDWLYEFLKNPEQTYGASTLDHGAAPKEAAYVARLPDDEIKAIARFISELKADQGSASAAVPPDGRSEFIDSMVKTWAPEEWKEKYSDIRDKQPATSE